MVSSVTLQAMGSALTAMARGSIITSSSLMPARTARSMIFSAILSRFLRVMGDTIVIEDESD
ncbi:MAG: hypothetical protein MZV63_52395 [Marinilabiliales bacterium]|nr:hypothetical protein [Marinilabiliales bacterium]